MEPMGREGPWLVTGAGGFLGVHVAHRALQALPRGGRLVCQVHGATAAARTLARELLPAKGTVAVADLADPAQRAGLLDDLAPGTVIHAAALSRIADCESDPGRAQEVNAAASEAIARWCAARGARLVHVSTDLVFGAREAPPGGFTEEHEPGTLSVYGRTKLAAEAAVAAAHPSSAIVRLPLLLGPSHGRGLGASDSVLLAHGRGEVPRLFVDEWRTPLDVRSAAEALVELARRDFAGRLHVAGPERLSRHEIGLRALRRLGLRADQARAALAASSRGESARLRPADVSLDAARARALLRTLLVGLPDGAG